MVSIGDVIQVDEADYCYGLGPLRMRIIEIIGDVRCRNDTWIELRGVSIRWNGQDGDERWVTVRSSALLRRRSGSPRPR